MPVGFSTGFYCADGADAKDIFSNSAPLINAITMNTLQMSEIQLDTLRYSDNMGLVPYDSTNFGMCGESSVGDFSSSLNRTTRGGNSKVLSVASIQGCP